jgi:hypothetical protein
VFTDHSSYNPIFERLVDEEKDLVLGLVAYGCYKIAKREWVESVRVNTGCRPMPDQLRAYSETWTPSRLESARKQADLVPAAHTNRFLESRRAEMLTEALRGSFWRSVWPSMFASALYTLALIALVIIASRAGVDLLGIVDSLTKK